MEKNVQYITTTLPYVNGKPHIGHAMEFIRADSLARSYKERGDDVFFNTGTDEHGQKIYEKAAEAGIDVQEYVDQNAQAFKSFVEKFNLCSDIHFIRTTDEKHIAAAQEIWKRCNENGYIYKKNYQTKYCVGCELEKTDSELVDSECPDHMGRQLELIDEDNYFFAFSKLQDALLKKYSDNPHFVVPDFRYNEIKSFVKSGLQDFSISRLKEKMSWGVPVPDDAEHVMYVWFDALTSYISTLGWPNEDKDSDFIKYWKEGNPIQYCGKDNLRQQSAMWQAMLLAADLPLSHHIIINGFIISDGKKMSKTMGNVIDPFEILDIYKESALFPEDVLRYYALRHVHAHEDSDMTLAKLSEAYRANLVNGIGNLTSRLMNMVVSYEVEYDGEKLFLETNYEHDDVYNDALKDFRFDRAMDRIWMKVNSIDEMVATKEPFKKIKVDPEAARADLVEMIEEFVSITVLLAPLMPRTATHIRELIIEKKKPESPLFNRIES